jgi:Flp pilus assembly pilin Flp
MPAFRSKLSALIKDERGMTALAYGLIAGLVAAVIVLWSPRSAPN